jgi:tetratricopeptide (TPR) repeat protein
MAETGTKLGKLGLAIVESFVESNLDETIVTDLRAPTDEQAVIEKAMQATADCLRKEWADKRQWNSIFMWNALFNLEPKKKELLIALKEAAKIFYDHPIDMGFAGVLTEILQESNEFSQEVIQKAVEEYIAVLTEELLLADKDFRENMRGVADLHAVEIPRSEEQPLVIQQPPIYKNIYDGITPRQVAEDELQAALARLVELPEDEIPTPASMPKGSRFPNIRPNPLFVGREDDLKRLAVWLKGESPVAIGQVAAATGIGGVGKTELASEFAHRYGRFFTGGVYWLSFAEPELIPFEVAACGGLADDNPLENRVKQVLSQWQSGMPRLLIFDNCEDPHLLMQWRPHTGASRVLVTSHLSNWTPALGFKQLKLGMLERSESIALLRGFREDLETNDPDLDAIAGELEDLPLALKIAGSYLRAYRNEMNPWEYLNALRQLRLLKRRSLEGGKFSQIGYDLDVERCFAICVNQLDQDGETDHLPLDLLKRIACFASGESIPRELLKTSAGEEIASNVFGDGVDRLLEMGLVEENELGDIRMHRLVACFIRNNLLDKSALVHVEKAVSSAASDANISGYPSRMRPVLAHLKYLTDLALKRGDEQAANIANNLGYYLEVIADYAGARPYYEQALAIRRKVLGEEHPDTILSFNNLGGLLESMGDYSGAWTNYEQVLANQRKTLGEEHPDTARSLYNLGGLLYSMGDYPSARLYFAQALAIHRKVLGDEHPDTVRNVNKLGALMQAMGDRPGARAYFEEALAIRRKVLGEKHTDADRSLNKLEYLLKPKVVLPGLFILLLAVIGWQVFAQGLISSALASRTATPTETDVPQSSVIFPGPTSTTSKTASSTPTTTPPPTSTPTPTSTVSSTSTRYSPYLPILPTMTPRPVVIDWTNTPLPTNTPVTLTVTPVPPTGTPVPPTVTPVPPTVTPIPPTVTPIPTGTPTSHLPTDIPTQAPTIP